MRRRRHAGRRAAAQPARSVATRLERVQVAATFLLLLMLAVTAAGYFSAQHLLRVEAVAQRVELAGEEI
jgi:hypothetical protein